MRGISPICLESGLSRRHMFSGLALGGLGIITGCATTPPEFAVGEAAQREAALPANAPTLFMITSKACPSCQAFYTFHYPRFQKMPERERIRIVVLHSPSISIPPLTNLGWAGSYDWVLGEARKHGLLMATPLFVLTRETRYLVAGYGMEDWQTDIIPVIRRETGLT